MTARYGFWYQNEKGNLSSGTAGECINARVRTPSIRCRLSAQPSLVITSSMRAGVQFERHNENHYPDSTARSISVAGDFVGGGFVGQESQDHTIQLEFQNITTLTRGNHAIRFGTRLRDTRDANLTNASFNGKFVFSPVTVGIANYAASQVYELMANGLASGHTFNSLVSQGIGPSSAGYATGNESALANVFDVALFAQDDVKINPRLTISGGLRWEAQNHIADHDDWAPRAELAFALDGGKGRKTRPFFAPATDFSMTALQRKIS